MKQIIELDVSLKNTILGNNNWIRLFSNIENSILGIIYLLDLILKSTMLKLEIMFKLLLK